jgi:mannose-6-phosphate isomerase-like protein (cupin superfamily)
MPRAGKQRDEGDTMAGFSITALEDVPDVMGDYPGEMRMCANHIGADQVAFTWRRMPPQTGGKGSYGHRHKTQEEIYFVVSGELEFKLDDEVMLLGAGTVVRISPEVLRSVWNEGPEDVVLIMVSRRLESQEGEVELVQEFWPA